MAFMQVHVCMKYVERQISDKVKAEGQSFTWIKDLMGGTATVLG